MVSGGADAEGLGQVVELVDELAAQGGDDGRVGEGGVAGLEVVLVHGVAGEGVAARGFGDGGAAAGAEGDDVGVEAGT